MLIKATDLFNLPVIAEGYKVGQINQPIIDPESGNLLGYSLHKKNSFSSSKVISTSDILQGGKNFILLNSLESIVHPTEVIRIDEVLKSKIKVFSAKAFNEREKLIGKIEDLLINLETNTVLKYYIKGWFHHFIMPSSKVIRIEKKGIIFSIDPSSPQLIKKMADA